MKTAEQPLRRSAPPDGWSLRRQYAEEAARPLSCLLLLFPLVATYEFGALILRPEVGPGQQLVAHSLIQRLLGWFGASGVWLPAAALVLTLLIWHLLRRYPWRIRGWVLALMVVESLLLTVPLFVLWQVMRANGSAPVVLDLRRQIVLALGAGIYEELVFRLYLITGLTWLLAKVLRVSKKVGGPLVIVLSAMVFAACHFAPVGSESFAWKHFLLLMLAGVYLAVVFLRRGLGVVAGCHAAFNLIPLLLWSTYG